MTLEASRGHRLASGGNLTFSLEAGYRHDGGDAEIGGGVVRYTDPAGWRQCSELNGGRGEASSGVESLWTNEHITHSVVDAGQSGDRLNMDCVTALGRSRFREL